MFFLRKKPLLCISGIQKSSSYPSPFLVNLEVSLIEDLDLAYEHEKEI